MSTASSSRVQQQQQSPRAPLPPPSIAIPTSDIGLLHKTLQGQESRHFITTKEFELYVKQHPQLRLRPGTGTGTAASAGASAGTGTDDSKSTTTVKGGKGYKAPQHPASHVFQTIPPRAPSRSSRSTILSYTLHLATSARLAAYTAPNGARDLLQQAESSGTRRSPSNVDVDLDFLETELKAQGMWKLGAALLKSSNRGAIAGISDSTNSAMDGTPTALLPPAVERRAALASLIENLLVDASAGVPGEASDNGGRTGSGAGEDLASPSQAKVVIVASDQLDSINALKPLTSPDTTTLYHSTTTSTTPLPAALDGKGTGSASDITKTGTAGEHRGSTSNTVASGSGVHAGLAGRASIAQSLIDLKFGGGGGSAAESGAAPKGDGADRDTTSMSLDKDVKPSREAETVFGAVSSSAGVGRVDSDPATAASGGLHTTPHMDYRIVRGQAMRSRARTIYAQSVLVPEGSTSSNTASAWCRRHRVVSCSVCRAVAQLSRKLDRRTLNLPGQGLREEMSRGGAPGRGGIQDGKKLRLVELVPDFLDLSAELLRDQHEKIIAANGAGVKHESDRDDSVSATTTMMNAGTEWTPTPGPAWYALLHSLVIQAVLEGYLVDGWTGTGGLETLLGVGCGVWEGRGWDTRMIVEEREELERVAAAVEAGRKGKSDQRGGQDGAGQGANVVQKEENEDDDEQSDDDEEDDEEEDDDDDDVEAERARERHEAKRKLIDAARALFGSRDAAQAEFELSMRDRTHEFLNVPESSDLRAHLTALSAKYPLSTFENDMVDFLESATRQLGKPALARYDAAAVAKSITQTTAATSSPSSGSSSTATSTDNGLPDPYALAKYFTRVKSSSNSVLHDDPDQEDIKPVIERHTGGTAVATSGKRRRMD